MESAIIELLGQADYVPSNVPELLSALKWAPERQQELQQVLKELVTQGKIVRAKGNRYLPAREADLVAGVIQITRGGRGFLLPTEPGATEISIPESATSTAMHGDRVLVRRDVKPQGLNKAPVEGEVTGSVIRILERKRSTIVGTLQKGKQFLYVVPDDPRLPRDIMVPPAKDVGRQPNIGDKVVVELVHWESRHASPEGEIIEVLGAPDQEGVDMLSVLKHYDLPLSFPKHVLKEANTIAKSRPDNQPAEEETKGRVDCRSHLVVTIDPDDAKDFDDAICLQRHGRDRWRLWVHIADVSHYVKPGSALDIEAKKRGNSTYLVDRVIPMLPEALSNELCSLKPGLDRLTKCVEFVLSEEGKVISTSFYPAVIHSRRRFTYKEAMAVIEKGKSGDAIERMILDAHRMAQMIRQHRFDHGSLDMDFPESKIRLDEHGKVLRIEKIENDVSHQLIEEYMLLANEAVAGRLMHLRRLAVYRVHESPKEKKLKDYREDVLAHKVPCGNLSKRTEVQKLLALLGTLPIGAALKIGFLRSMMRARYAMEPLGHYGLNKAKYTHFTSPIRRYADLVVHRALFEHDSHPLTAGRVQEIADHITGTERNSSDAERASKEVKLYAYLNEQIKSGKRVIYPGLVTDVRNFGFFVDVSTLGLSGMVHLSSVPDEFFVFDPVRARLIGRHSGQIIRLGETLQVQVHRVDGFKKQVDFRMVSEGRQGSEAGAGAERERRFERPSRRSGGAAGGRGSEKPERRTTANDQSRWKAEDRRQHEREREWKRDRGTKRGETRGPSATPPQGDGAAKKPFFDEVYKGGGPKAGGKKKRGFDKSSGHQAQDAGAGAGKSRPQEAADKSFSKAKKKRSGKPAFKGTEKAAVKKKKRKEKEK